MPGDLPFGKDLVQPGRVEGPVGASEVEADATRCIVGVGFRLSDELVGRGGAARPDLGGSVDPGGDGGGSYEGRTQGEEQGESCCEQHVVDG